MTKPFRCLLINALLLCLISTVSCEDRDRLAGKYLAESTNNLSAPTVFLELGANGKGSWAVEDDIVSFEWEIRAEEIWLHTKSGGVIVGKLVGDTIQIELPGIHDHRFKKVEM